MVVKLGKFYRKNAKKFLLITGVVFFSLFVFIKIYNKNVYSIKLSDGKIIDIKRLDSPDVVFRKAVFILDKGNFEQKIVAISIIKKLNDKGYSTTELLGAALAEDMKNKN